MYGDGAPKNWWPMRSPGGATRCSSSAKSCRVTPPAAGCRSLRAQPAPPACGTHRPVPAALASGREPRVVVRPSSSWTGRARSATGASAISTSPICRSYENCRGARRCERPGALQPLTARHRVRPVAVGAQARPDVMAYTPIEQGRILGPAVLRQVAARHQATPVQIALAWVIRQDGVVAIPRASSSAHVRENAGAPADQTLGARSGGARRRISAAERPASPRNDLREISFLCRFLLMTHMKSSSPVLLVWTLAAGVMTLGACSCSDPPPAQAATQSPPPAPGHAAARRPGTALPPEIAARLVRPHSPIIGPASAPVTVVEFLDPACEGCRRLHPS